ncbi:MAG: FtsW/RodA/SpoVE family cell cycle protein [Enterococcus sp.]
MPKKIKKRHFLDWSILLPYLVLCILGLMMVYSSTSYLLVEADSNPMASVMNQFLFWLISLAAIGLIYKLKLDFLRKKGLAGLAIFVILILLLIVLLFGEEVNGAKGWLTLGGFSIQPAEYLKIVAIWYLSVSLANRQPDIQTSFLKQVRTPLLWIGLCLGIIMAMPDFGNAAVILLIVFAVLAASGINYLYTYWLLPVGIVGSMGAIWVVIATGGKFLPEHVYNRFAIFTNPFADEYNLGHQMVNGYYAMFNGGLLGRGLGNSIQKKGFLQFAQTDYIFAIVIEELGLIMAILILALLFYMICRIFLVGIRSKDPFNSLMCIGIGSLFMIQTFVNLGGITGIIPLTGITFPFLSQGGSSLLMLSICIGFVLNISAEEKRNKILLDIENSSY